MEDIIFEEGNPCQKHTRFYSAFLTEMIGWRRRWRYAHIEDVNGVQAQAFAGGGSGGWRSPTMALSLGGSHKNGYGDLPGCLIGWSFAVEGS